MWFAGLLIGGLIGGLIGAFGGATSAFIGAIAGTIAGAIVGAALKPGSEAAAKRIFDIEFKLGHIYKSLEDIHWRLLRLEKPGEQQTPAARIEVPTQTMTAAEAAETAPAAPTAAAAVLAGEPAPQPQAAVETHPQAEPHRQPTGPLVADRAHSEALLVGSGPSWWQRLLSGNIVAKAGVIILFFGVGFLLKYAYDHAMLPVPLRLGAVAAAGFGMLFGGWRLQATRRLYGLILQGAGVGLLYLDVFFALRVFALVEPTLGFALFMLLGVAATLLAVRQDAKVLAVLGLAGAFMAPVLAGSREDNHVMLFSYYTLLNAFILAISWFKSWRDLNLTGFIFTFIVGVLWGAGNYRPGLFATVEPFVLIFFAMYLVIPILFATRQPPDLKGLVDGTLVFGTPLSAAFMQAALVRDMPYGLAWSAGCAAGLYAVVAVLVLRRAGLRLLGETYVALAVVFATMAIFFALDAYPTFALWTLEGAAIVWVGLRQRRLLARLFGIALQFGGAGLFLLHYPDYALANPWFNDFIFGCALIAAAGMITSWLMHEHREVLIEGGEAAAAVLLVWACGWWFVGGLHALHDGVPRNDFHAAVQIASGLGFVVGSCLLFEIAGSGLRWAALRRTQALLLPAMVLAAILQIDRHLHPAAGQAWLAWIAAFAAFYTILYRQQKDGIGLATNNQHVLAVWLATGLVAWELAWQFAHLIPGTSWPFAMWGLLPALTMFALSVCGRQTWPWRQDFGFFRNACLGPVALYCVAWSLLSTGDPGRTAPLPYLPLVNPVDLAQAIVLCGLHAWLRAADVATREREVSYSVVLAALGFVWVNSIVLRSIHHWLGVPFTAHELFESMVVQAAFSLLWTTTALVMMLAATRRLQRKPWLAGAALLTVVVGKLFLLDLANSGTVARIVSFLGVGVLLLVIGYFAPVPPGDTEKQQG